MTSYDPRRWPEKVLMLVVDPGQCGDRSLSEVVEKAIDGGVNVVQLRAPGLPAGELLSLARRLRGICAHRSLLVVNDRLDVAVLSGADGVHLPENGLPVSAARQLLPPSIRVGRSVHSINAARQAESDGADYVVLGTIFASPTHPDQQPAGIELVSNVTRRLKIPVVAIGGITPENADACWSAGATGIAVISSILKAEDPQAAAQRLAPACEEREKDGEGACA